MSPLAKVFVVLVLILSLGFLGVSATLFTARKDYKATFDKMLAAASDDAAKAAKKISDLKGQNEQNDVTINAQRTQIQGLESDKDNLQNDLGDKEKDIARKDGEITDLKTQVSLRDKRIEDKDTEIARLTATNESLSKEAEDARTAKQIAETQRARAFLDRRRLDEELAQAKIEVTSTREELEGKEAILQAAIAKGIDLNELIIGEAAPPIEGTVVAVRPEAQLAILSVGQNDKVKEGYEFTISRGAQFIAKVRVIRVTDDMAGARILWNEDGRSVEVGDKASNRI